MNNRLVLETGSDIATAVLCAVDNNLIVHKQEQVIVSTGGDGNYVLHLYMDQEIPQDIMCSFVAHHKDHPNIINQHIEVAEGKIAWIGQEDVDSLLVEDCVINVPSGIYSISIYFIDGEKLYDNDAHMRDYDLAIEKQTIKAIGIERYTKAKNEESKWRQGCFVFLFSWFLLIALIIGFGLPYKFVLIVVSFFISTQILGVWDKFCVNSDIEILANIADDEEKNYIYNFVGTMTKIAKIPQQN